MTPPPPVLRPALEPDFSPVALWHRAFHDLVAQDPSARPFRLELTRPDGSGDVHTSRVLGAAHRDSALNLRYAERLLKFLLWAKGGSRVTVVGAPEIAAHLAHLYRRGGERAFDADFMGAKIYRDTFTVRSADTATEPSAGRAGQRIGRHTGGCRIGFDLGGSDRKAAALIDGEVVYSEQLPWNPYFEPDPTYHVELIHDCLRRAAAHLPRVDAIGGSAAGVYVDNEVRVASLFRGVSPDRFERDIRRMFITLQQRWRGVPFEVANDGEVTALAGSIGLNANRVLGVSMGTSLAGGYVNGQGNLTTWLNELAFVPVDLQPHAAIDEWSGDAGCGVQYFSQQGVIRFARRAGFAFAADAAVPQCMRDVLDALQHSDPRAIAVFTSLGICFGYTVADWATHYDISHLILLGGVTSHGAGDIIIEHATAVLRAEFPDIAKSLQLTLPAEHQRRHGQAITAATLPPLAAPAPATRHP